MIKGDIVKIRVIVIEDDYALRTVISNILKDRGYEVFDSSNPSLCPIYLDSKCLCVDEHICASIIITDINMPYMRGLEFIDHQRGNGCKVPNIAVMSGSWTDEELEHAKRIGCHTFNKPFKINEIKKWLDACESKLYTKNKLSDLHISRQEVLSY